MSLKSKVSREVTFHSLSYIFFATGKTLSIFAKNRFLTKNIGTTRSQINIVLEKRFRFLTITRRVYAYMYVIWVLLERLVSTINKE